MIYDETTQRWVPEVTEVDVRDADRELATCCECDRVDYAGFMFGVEGGVGRCDACQYREDADDRDSERRLNRYLDALIAESVKEYRR